MIRGVAFDLDGTLLDTLDDLTNAVNMFLERNSYPTRSKEEIRQMIGNGASMLISRALPHENFTPEQIQNYYEEYRVIYRDNQKYTHLFDGIGEVLDYLQANHIRIGVVTNKHDEAAKFCMKLYLNRWEIEPAVGQTAGIPVKPNPFMLNKVISSWGFDKSEVLFVGDSPEDIETALNAGVKSIGAGWGFRSSKQLADAGADFCAENPKILLEYLSRR